VQTDVLVVGAGPAGSTAAANLAKDHDVVLVEEHSTPGRPVQCAGLITPRGVPSFAQSSVVGKVRGARIHSPLGSVLELEAREDKAFVVDRGIFDRLLFERAVDRGASAMTGTRLVSLSGHEDAPSSVVKTGSEELTISSRTVIGSDGYRSTVRRAAKLPPPRHILTGIQAEVTGLEMDDDFVELFLGEKVAPGFFAWAIPAGDVARVGLCTWRGEHAPAVFLKRLLSRPEFSKAKKVSTYSGKIPLGPGRSSSSGRVLLAGDAACHAKPLSGGGVYTGITGAELCSECIHSFLVTDEIASLESYDSLWKESFGRELAKAFRIRKVFLSLSDKKMDKALRIFEDPRLMALLQERGDIDYPASLSSQVLKLAPKLAQFSPQLIESLLK
jgi:geranylgeranyl reductase family protein